MPGLMNADKVEQQVAVLRSVIAFQKMLIAHPTLMSEPEDPAGIACFFLVSRCRCARVHLC
jgi:hypothetical protein